ncbi:MAG: extracellular solute-binding protein [Clostridiales bacterium]|jgi:putative aldouronate transport system substrate-binding protein|nr:extracellular solute-binding protein [Clostridiales bacterium]
MYAKKRWASICVSVLLAVGVFTGCSGAQSNDPDAPQSQTSITATADAASDGAAANVAASTDPFGRYDEPITISAVKNLGVAPLEFPEGDSLENNVWMRYYKDNLNIQIDWLWSTLESQYDQKVNIAITSGDIPDLMMLKNANQLKMMYENGQLYPVGDILETYGAPFTKEVLNSDGGFGLESASFDGALYAVPHIESGLMSSPVLWVRTDWLEKYSLALPTTKEEFLKVSEAFSTDGAYGLGINKDLFETNYAALEGFFNMHGAFNDTWFEKDGSLVYSDIQPEVKDTLEMLQSMYANGWIDPEFGVKNTDKVNEDVNAGKIGMMFGGFWNAVMFNPAKVADPTFEWMPVAIPEVLNGSGKAQVPFGTKYWYAISADCKNPEAIIRMLNVQLEKAYGETAESMVFNITPEGYGPFNYNIFTLEPPMKNFVAAEKVTKAIETGDPSALNLEELNYYEMSLLSLGGDHTNNNWHQLKMFGPLGSLSVQKSYWDSGNAVTNAFYGAPTPTMVEKLSTLKKQALTDFTAIIMGGDINGFDTFVSNWNALGGADITSEVNEWYTNR